MSATSREASANRMASFCESFRVGSIHSMFPTSSLADKFCGTGEGLDSPNSTLMKLEYSDSPIFCSFSIVWFILVMVSLKSPVPFS